jgi:hypothetical protein
MNETGSIYRAIHSSNAWEQKEAFDALDALVKERDQLHEIVEDLLKMLKGAQMHALVRQYRERLEAGPYNDASCPPDTDNH